MDVINFIVELFKEGIISSVVSVYRIPTRRSCVRISCWPLHFFFLGTSYSSVINSVFCNERTLNGDRKCIEKSSGRQ